MRKFAHIEIKPLAKRPDDWTDQRAWPGPGLYAPENDNGWLSLVTPDGVHILYAGVASFAVVNDNPGVSDGINESLLLKAIAAASRAETLKGA